MSWPHGSTFAAQMAGEGVLRRRPSSVPLRIFAICLTSVTITVHYTNYGPLIPTLRGDLHVDSSQVGLLSTLLFLGLAVAYIPAGALIDRYGSRPVLLGSTITSALGGILLPLFPNFSWLLACRAVIGLGLGGSFVAGAHIAANLGKHSSLGQGLYGGFIQVGTGLGLLVTPLLLAHFGWRGAFLCWGLLGLAGVVVWLFVNDGEEAHTPTKIDIRSGIRSPAVWTLGLSHLGTFGLGNAMAAWISVYLAFQYNLPLALAATFGSIALLSGVFFRPLGGILIARRVIGPIPLLRMGTIMNCAGVGLLAIPVRFPPLAVAGLALIGIGATMPYTSVFNEAARLRGVGKGVSQALVSIISIPAVIVGPPLIGFFYQRTSNFTLAFGSVMIFGFIAITASFLAGPAVKRETVA
jgi:predicted MFS family arabinose efflux permease